MDKNNFIKHDSILKNKKDIIKMYNECIPIQKISVKYNVTTGCISNNLKLWGVRKKHGLRFLLRNLL